jgi:predicted nucleic acid-binding protein
MATTVASNTGPLIALAKADQLALLQTLYKDAQIPSAVHRELMAKSGIEAERLDLALASFVRVVPMPPLPPEVDRLTRGLGPGEQQALALAYATGGLLLIDDRAGRSAARRLGVNVTGVVGVLIRAKQEGHIPMIRPILEVIRNHGYWLSDSVVETAVKLAGESPTSS